MRTSVLVAVLVLIPISYSDAQVPAIERDALIALDNSTDGASWSRNNNWLGAVGTECTWSGVNCTGGHVQRLALGGNQLSGSLPTELENLTNLQDEDGLNLSWNALYSNDATLIAFLNTKQDGGDWQGTQTIAPENLAVAWVGDQTAGLSWTW